MEAIRIYENASWINFKQIKTKKNAKKWNDPTREN